MAKNPLKAFICLRHPIRTVSKIAIKHYIKYETLPGIVTAHIPEMTYSWLYSIPRKNIDEYGRIKDYQEDGRCPKPLYLYGNCPVDIEIYSSAGQFWLGIVNDEIIQDAESPVDALIDDSGQKIINVPADITANIKITATDDGFFTYSAQSMDFEKGEISKVISYYEIPISKGDKLESNVYSSTSGEDKEVVLYNTEGDVIQPSEVLSESEIDIFTVSLLAEGDGFVSGETTVIKGEFAQVSAIPADGSTFRGWFSNEELVSNEADYRFCVLENVQLTARFAEKPAGSDISGNEGNKDNKDNKDNSSAKTEKESTLQEPAYLTLNVSGIIPMKVKQTCKKVKVTGMASDDKVISWKSDNTKIVTVSKTGVLKAKSKTGTAIITVKTKRGAKASFKVKVQKKKVVTKKVKVKTKKENLVVKKKLKLKPIITPITSQDKLSYFSSNSKVASVSKNGVVKGKKKGKTIITIKSGKKKVKVNIIVK